jgi:hypothetical protein
VCNEEGDIFGLLDITKCIYEALNKMEKAYGSSRKLYDALEGVEREWANSPVQFVQYMEALRDKMSCPDLTTVLDHAGPVQVAVKAQVREVAKLMKEYHTTAVLVMDHGGLAGIFTVSDISAYCSIVLFFLRFFFYYSLKILYYVSLLLVLHPIVVQSSVS